VYFAGLTGQTLLALFGVVGALFVVLYILKLRRRAVAVPFSPLWKRIMKEKDSTSLFSKLKRLLSLLLQLLILALLILALGDPRAVETLVKGRTVVFLIDASASMQATMGDGQTRLDVARERVRAMIRAMGGRDRLLLVSMDSTVTPLGPMSSDPVALEKSLGDLSATDTRADFARALRFAKDALYGADNGEIVVVSDGALGEPKDAHGTISVSDIKLSFVPVGEGERNVAITQFSVRRYPLDKSRHEVMLEVINTGPEPEEIELTLVGDGLPVDITRLRIAPGERLPRFYPKLSGASRTLEARLAPLPGSVDLLAADNRAYALLPERRRAKVLVVTEGNAYLEAALLLDEYLDVTEIRPRAYPAVEKSEKWDAIIFDSVTPGAPPPTHALYLNPKGPGSPVKVDKEVKNPGIDKVERKHPVVRFMALENVNIAKANRLVPELGDKAVGRMDDGAALVVAGARAGNKFLALGFDVRESDLPMRIAWPLLLLNTINWFVDEDARYLSSVRTGEVWRIGLPGSRATQAKLKQPDGSSLLVPIHEGRAVMLGQRAGFYELSLDGAEPLPDGTSPLVGFAANLVDEAESRIAPQSTVRVGGHEAGEPSPFRAGPKREIWLYLLAAAVVLLTIEWVTYHRRLTV
jgi:hypothetical protein